MSDTTAPLAPVRLRTRPSASALSEYYTRQEAADALGITPPTLGEWTAAGNGPPATKIGGRFFYRKAALAAWLALRETRPAG
ncbi:MAG TPA: helix-turn-helix domain-containing protein [Vineibacter sp.]|nr:helix-turn-helix domain-containing protein [Vineibacter sp.]